MSFKILSVRIDSLSQSELEEAFRTQLHQKHFAHIATVNPEFLVEANTHKEFRDLLNKTLFNICDGAGISTWARILYRKKIVRIPGVEVAETLCKIASEEGSSVYFLGGFGVAETATKAMKKKFPKLIIAGSEDGNTENCSQKLINSKPGIIFVAFGAPKQEFWIQKFAKESGALIAIGIGGTFDFWAGKIPRAPQWMRKLGIEWIFRFVQEPKKRAKRISRAVFKFSWLVWDEFLEERFRS
jgi:N-acetylglucosaminyldiphosphoundecaprenol N-acetyl-beta-D-mannosaminyltransferase